SRSFAHHEVQIPKDRTGSASRCVGLGRHRPDLRRCDTHPLWPIRLGNDARLAIGPLELLPWAARAGRCFTLSWGGIPTSAYPCAGVRFLSGTSSLRQASTWHCV